MAGLLVERGADFLIALKGNQPKLHGQVKDLAESALPWPEDSVEVEHKNGSKGRRLVKSEPEFEDLKGQEVTTLETVAAKVGRKRIKFEGLQTRERGHGREEVRRYYLTRDLRTLEGLERWEGLEAVGFVESERWEVGASHATIERRFFVTSVKKLEAFARGVRSHWGIENEAHWALDVVFKEDQCKAYARAAAENLGVFRRWVHNLLLQRRRAGKTKETAPVQRVELLLEDDPRREVLGNLVAQEV